MDYFRLTSSFSISSIRCFALIRGFSAFQLDLLQYDVNCLALEYQAQQRFRFEVSGEHQVFESPCVSPKKAKLFMMINILIIEMNY